MRFHPTHIALALAGMAASAGSQAAVTAHAWIDQIGGGPYEITSDGKTYSGVTGPGSATLNVSGALAINSGNYNKWIRSYSVWPFLLQNNTGAGIQEFTQLKKSVVFDRDYLGTNQNQSEIYPQFHKFNMSIGPTLLLPYLMGRCNAWADQLRANGMSNAAIFAQDWQIPIGVDANMHWALKPGSEEGYTGFSQRPADKGPRPTITLVCKQHKAPQQPGTTAGQTAPATGPALVTAASISIPHSTLPQRCPVELTATITVRSAASNGGQPLAPGWMSYRVLSASGLASPSDNIFFQQHEKQGNEYVRVIQQKFTVPRPGGSAPAGAQPGQGGAVSGAAGGLVQGGSGGGRTGGVSGAAVGGGYASAPTDPNVHQDSLWVDVGTAKQGSVARSGNAAYRITCQPETNFNQPATGLQNRPGPQEPPTHGGGSQPPQRPGATPPSGVPTPPGGHPNPPGGNPPPPSNIPTPNNIPTPPGGQPVPPGGHPPPGVPGANPSVPPAPGGNPSSPPPRPSGPGTSVGNGQQQPAAMKAPAASAPKR